MGRRQSNTSTYHFRQRGQKDSLKGHAHKVTAYGHWFWIDLADQKSKALSEALYSLLYSGLGASKPGDPIPTLRMDILLAYCHLYYGMNNDGLPQEMRISGPAIGLILRF